MKTSVSNFNKFIGVQSKNACFYTVVMWNYSRLFSVQSVKENCLSQYYFLNKTNKTSPKNNVKALKIALLFYWQ